MAGKLSAMGPGDSRSIGESLGRIAGFEVVEREALERLAKVTERVFVKKNEVVCEEGGLPSFFFGVEVGLVRLFKTSENGLDITVNIIRDGQFFNALVLLQKMPHYWTAVALEDSTLLRIWKSDYHDFVKSNPDYAIRLLQINGYHLRVAYERVQDAFAAAASQRIAGSLCMLYCRFGAKIRITNAQLADLSGSTTATTIRMVKRFREMGLVSTRRGLIEVKNAAGLEEQSGRGLASLDTFSRDYLD